MRFTNPFHALHAFRGRHHFGPHFGGHHHADGDRAAYFLDHVVGRAARKLDLTVAQQDLLATLLRELQAQRAAMKTALPDLKGLLAGDSFDRAAATQMLDARLDALRAAGPSAIDAAGNFFDSLDGEQKQALRFLMRTRQSRCS